MATKEEILEVYKFFDDRHPTDAAALTYAWAITQERRSVSNSKRPEPIPMPSGGAPIKGW